MNEPLYAVTGAAGQTGQAAVQSLLERGASVRALVRGEDDRSATLATAGAEIAVVDLFDPRALEPALAGVSGVYLAVPGSDYMLEAVAAFLVAARNQEVQSVVYLSQWLAHHSAAAPGPNQVSGDPPELARRTAPRRDRHERDPPNSWLVRRQHPGRAASCHAIR